MARRLKLSRSRFYQLVERRVFLPPVYCPWTRRPFFTAEMQRRNLEVRESQIAINGAYVLFYSRQQTRGTTPAQSRQGRRGASQAENAEERELAEGLRGLGLSDVTAREVRAALAAVFPQGATDVPHSRLLRDLYRHLKRQRGAR